MGVDPENFFSAKRAVVDEMRLLCFGCPVFTECKLWSDIARPEDGLWAAQTGTERKKRYKKEDLNGKTKNP